MAGDSLDKYRNELNTMLLKKVTESNAIVLDKMVTIRSFLTHVFLTRRWTGVHATLAPMS
jgi:hypothetical protein